LIRNDEISLYALVSFPITHLTHSKTYFLTSPVCQRLFQPTKPYAATSMHHSVDHLIAHGYVDQAAHATTGWSTSVRTPTFLQLIYGSGPSSVDMERRYGPGYSYVMMMMIMMMNCLRFGLVGNVVGRFDDFSRPWARLVLG